MKLKSFWFIQWGGGKTNWEFPPKILRFFSHAFPYHILAISQLLLNQFWPNPFDPNFFWPNFFYLKVIWTQIFFKLQIVLGQKNFGPNFIEPNLFRTKYFLHLQFFWTQNFVGPKKFLDCFFGVFRVKPRYRPSWTTVGTWSQFCYSNLWAKFPTCS